MKQVAYGHTATDPQNHVYIQTLSLKIHDAQPQSWAASESKRINGN